MMLHIVCYSMLYTHEIYVLLYVCIDVLYTYIYIDISINQYISNKAGQLTIVIANIKRTNDDIKVFKCKILFTSSITITKDEIITTTIPCNLSRLLHTSSSNSTRIPIALILFKPWDIKSFKITLLDELEDIRNLIDHCCNRCITNEKQYRNYRFKLFDLSPILKLKLFSAFRSNASNKASLSHSSIRESEWEFITQLVPFHFLCAHSLCLVTFSDFILQFNQYIQHKNRICNGNSNSIQSVNSNSNCNCENSIMNGHHNGCDNTTNMNIVTTTTTNAMSFIICYKWYLKPPSNITLPIGSINDHTPIETSSTTESSTDNKFNSEFPYVIYHYMYQQNTNSCMDIRCTLQCCFCGCNYLKTSNIIANESSKAGISSYTTSLLHLLTLHLTTCHKHFDYIFHIDQYRNIHISVQRHHQNEESIINESSVVNLMKEKNFILKLTKHPKLILHKITILTKSLIARKSLIFSDYFRVDNSIDKSFHMIESKKHSKKQLLLVREYYEPRTGILLTSSSHSNTSIRNEINSSSSPNKAKILEQSNKLLDEFEDVSNEEKEFLKLWNKFVLYNPIHSRTFVGMSVRQFAEEYGREIIRHKLRYYKHTLYTVY